MGMDTLKNDLMDWIADTVAMWVTDDGLDLTKDLIENAIDSEMDSLKEDMLSSIKLIREKAKEMVKAIEELEGEE